MPSDDPAAEVLHALAAPLARFQSAIAAAVEELRGLLAAERASAAASGDVDRVELGAFAAGRIDAHRFAALIERTSALDAASLRAIEAAQEVLAALQQRAASAPIAVKPGESLRDAVACALAEVGRAFGAARVVALARSGRYREAEHAPLLDGYPRAAWSRAERALAPPIAAIVDGRGLHAEGLAEFIDGSQKIVLIVRPPAPPAPLARLVTPGTFVMQTTDAKSLARLARCDGPGVGALMQDGAACFVHDPSAGAAPWQRLSISSLPDAAALSDCGGRSAWQQAEDLRHLAALATAPPAPVAAAAAAGPVPAALPSAADPVDHLAAWLLGQAGVAAAR